MDRSVTEETTPMDRSVTEETTPEKIQSRVAEGLGREEICDNLETTAMLEETQEDAAEQQLVVEDLQAHLDANGQHLQLLATNDIQIQLELGHIRRRQARLELKAVRNKAEVEEKVRDRLDLSKKLKSATGGLEELKRKENLLKAKINTPPAPGRDPAEFWANSATPNTSRHRWGATPKLPKIFSKSQEKITRL